MNGDYRYWAKVSNHATILHWYKVFYVFIQNKSKDDKNE